MRGFSLVELLLVLAVLTVLTVGATPLYLGYAQDARTSEAKTLAGSLWTAVTTRAMLQCDQPTPLSLAFGRVGLDDVGATTPPRWRVTPGAERAVTLSCTSGTYAPEGDVFVVAGHAPDVSALRVKLVWSAGGAPPARLRCSVDAGSVWVDC